MSQITKWRVITSTSVFEFATEAQALAFVTANEDLTGLTPTQFVETLPDNTIENLKRVVAGAQDFGNQLLREISAENIAMGITQAGMTGVVRERLFNVMISLWSGSLYDAIAQLKATPENHKDGVFITNARLLSTINKIEGYLGIPLSPSL